MGLSIAGLPAAWIHHTKWQSLSSEVVVSKRMLKKLIQNEVKFLKSSQTKLLCLFNYVYVASNMQLSLRKVFQFLNKAFQNLFIYKGRNYKRKLLSNYRLSINSWLVTNSNYIVKSTKSRITNILKLCTLLSIFSFQLVISFHPAWRFEWK